MAAERIGVGIVGCGFISEVYLDNLRNAAELTVVACADQVPERAAARAAQFDIAKAVSVDDLLADPEIALVVNLTIPAAHAAVCLAAIRANKSVYTEKPLAIERDDGARVLAEAKARGLRVGAAPDTFLGGGLQTCRQLIDDGASGRPVAATAFMLNHGHEHWHPDPAFYYQAGGGPLFDMGPYYLTALVSLLGPVRRVTGSARASFAERTVTSQPRAGEMIPVAVSTHLAAVLDFAQGSIATLVTSFDVWAASVPQLEIYGTAGSLSLPDPNTFGGPVRLRPAGHDRWDEIPVTLPFTDNRRGLGAIDMVRSFVGDRPHRASGELADHVLEIMHAVETASRTGHHVEIASSCQRPAPLSLDPPLRNLPHRTRTAHRAAKETR